MLLLLVGHSVDALGLLDEVVLVKSGMQPAGRDGFHGRNSLEACGRTQTVPDEGLGPVNLKQGSGLSARVYQMERRNAYLCEGSALDVQTFMWLMSVKTFLMALTSAMSPTSVLVACALM